MAHVGDTHLLQRVQDERVPVAHEESNIVASVDPRATVTAKMKALHRRERPLPREPDDHHDGDETRHTDEDQFCKGLPP